MNKIHLLYGFLIGIAVAAIGCYLYIEIFTEYYFAKGFKILKSHGQVGKLITLGTVPNLAVFFLLLRMKKELMARCIVLAVIVLAFVSFLFLN
jgi:hypothetical protein